MTHDGFDEAWERVIALEGATFRQKTRRPFRYAVKGGGVLPSTTSRYLARTHFARAYARRPLTGPGQLQDLQGPSYLFAILTDPRIEHGHAAVPAHGDAGSTRRQDTVEPPRLATAEGARGEPSSELPLGCVLDPGALDELGFVPLELRIDTEIELGGAAVSNWTTLGAVPDAPGLYAFTLERPGEGLLRVVYVGMTEHLWMVTKGVLPSGAGRGGQRYGRPRHSGATRKRVNVLLTRAMREGWTPRHWVLPYRGSGVSVRAALLAEEAVLIADWDLRNCGWNRG